MQGGYINAELIDVKALVADNILVTEMGNIAGTYFETDGVTFTQKNGITLPAVINSVATSLDMNPQSLPDIASFLTASCINWYNEFATHQCYNTVIGNNRFAINTGN